MERYTVEKIEFPNQIEELRTVYELREASTNSWMKVAPHRGGLVFSLGIRGEEVLYLDEETFFDPTANVRGGIPILFPISGQLAQGEYVWKGQTYSMRNHGVARTNPWQVVSVETNHYAGITLELSSTAETRIEFPFDFKLRFEYVLHNGALTIHQTYINLSDEAMPMYAGFHPYFKSQVKCLTYQTDATQYLDYNNGQVESFSGVVDMGNRPESIVLLDAKAPHISFPVEGQSSLVTLSYGPEFHYVVLWSVAGKPFICVEPWMAKTFAFNRQEELVWVHPGTPCVTFLKIE